METSANVETQVLLTDGEDEELKAYCLKCQKPVTVFVRVGLQPAPSSAPEVGLRLRLDDPAEFQKQVSEVAKRMGLKVSWRKR